MTEQELANWQTEAEKYSGLGTEKALALIAEVRRLRERSEGCCRCTHPEGCQCWNDE